MNAANPALLVTNCNPLGTSLPNLDGRPLTFDAGHGLILDGYQRSMAGSGFSSQRCGWPGWNCCGRNCQSGAGKGI
jgi:hypothetical protein